jgi:hypothetical protein
VERRPLVLPDGTEAYIEPMNLMKVGSDFVVVGAPSYTWVVGGTRVIMASDRVHIAAYLDEVSPRLVEIPIRVRPGIVRSVVLDDGRWGVLFSQADPEERFALEGAVGLWYAEYDGTHWSDLERVPLPAEPQDLVVGTSSGLVRRDDALAWVVVYGHEGSILEYERRNGAWRFDVIEDRGMEGTAMASDPSGVWLALSGVDPELSEWTRSLRLFRWTSRGWQFVSRVTTVDPYTEIVNLFLNATPAGVTVTWGELSAGGAVAKARVGIGPDTAGVALVLDSPAQQAKPIDAPDGAPAWVVQHVNSVTGLSELRLVRAEGRDVSVEWAIPYPYTGFYAATAASPDEVLVTGSEFDPDPARPTVRSLTLRLSSSCH